MRSRWSLSEVSTATLSVCAVLLTVLVGKREFYAPQARMVQPGLMATPVDGWARVKAIGHRAGPDSAPVTLVVFDDYECPSCQYLETVTLPGIVREFAGNLAVVRRHAPLSYHRFAYPAARAAECAGVQGTFDAFHTLMFIKQDSLGLKSFHSFAAESGVRDLVAFDACVATPGGVPAVDRDFKAAQDLGMTGTPTVILDGRMFSHPPDSASLAKAIRSELQKRAG